MSSEKEKPTGIWSKRIEGSQDNKKKSEAVQEVKQVLKESKKQCEK